MLITNTNSLTYKIESENFLENFYKDKELFDFSKYPKDSKYYNNAKNLVAKKMKDETCDMSIKGFKWLKSKMYTFITEGNHEYSLIKMLLIMN